MFTLHWEFSNGHNYWKQFNSNWEVNDFIYRCGLDTHPYIIKIDVVKNPEIQNTFRSPD